MVSQVERAHACLTDKKMYVCIHVFIHSSRFGSPVLFEVWSLHMHAAISLLQLYLSIMTM